MNTTREARGNVDTTRNMRGNMDTTCKFVCRSTHTGERVCGFMSHTVALRVRECFQDVEYAMSVCMENYIRAGNVCTNMERVATCMVVGEGVGPA